MNPGLAYALSLIGLTMISASASVLIWAIEPILILLLAGLVLGERPGPAITALSFLAFAGLIVAVGAQVGGVALAGVAVSLAGVLCCVVYSVAARRWIEASPSTLGVVTSQQIVALGVVALALPVAGVAGWSIAPTSVTIPGLASVVASGVLYYGAAYLLYLNALRVLPVSIAAISFYLVPVFGVAAATAAGETLSGDPVARSDDDDRGRARRGRRRRPSLRGAQPVAPSGRALRRRSRRARVRRGRSRGRRDRRTRAPGRSTEPGSGTRP